MYNLSILFSEKNMKEKKSKTKTRINAVRNNFYALKLVWKMCPIPVLHMAIARLVLLRLAFLLCLFYALCN